MSIFLRTGGFKQINPKEFELNEYASNNSKGCVLKGNLGYPKNYINNLMIILDK